jgi:broad specificity polyphosphatase/5'/3'-nucleotidase SurE
VDLETLEQDSDVHALIVEKTVSVTPLTYDLTARVEARELEKWAVGSGQ